MPSPRISLLDHREFPSLSGAQQAQQSSASSSQAIWGNSAPRAPQSTIQRSTGQPSAIAQPIRPPSQLSAQTRQSDVQEENALNPFPSLGAGSDEYPFGQSPASQMARQHQQQQGLTEEFPPLGGLGGLGTNQPQRSRLGQAPVMGMDVGMSIPDHQGGPQQQPQEAKGLPSHERKISETAASRSTLNIDMTEQDGINGHDSTIHSRSTQLPFRSIPNGDPGRFNQPSQHQPALSGGFADGHAVEAGFQMTELERFGLKGLQARLDGVFGPDQAAIASGMDLNLLGLDLNRY